MNVLMVGVSKNRIGGMWTVANNYLSNVEFCKKTNVKYVATSSCGSIVVRLGYMIFGILQVLLVLMTSNIDIVHIHMAEKGSVFRKGIVAKISKLFGAKVIIHMHAGPFMSWFNSLNEKKKRIVLDILNVADIVAVLGEYWKKEIAQIIDERKLRVLYNGINISDENLYRLSATDIVFMGLLKKEKGVFDLIDAIKLIDNRLESSIKVKLCGSDVENNVSKYIDNLNLEHRIQMMGWVNENERADIYKNAVISVLPSYYEGLSMTIIESMSYGIPVVTTDISTMGEILGDEIKLVQPGDVDALAKTILEILNDEKIKEKMSRVEFERVNRFFSMTQMIKRTCDLYEEIL